MSTLNGAFVFCAGCREVEDGPQRVSPNAARGFRVVRDIAGIRHLRGVMDELTHTSYHGWRARRDRALSKKGRRTHSSGDAGSPHQGGHTGPHRHHHWYRAHVDVGYISWISTRNDSLA